MPGENPAGMAHESYYTGFMLEFFPFPFISGLTLLAAWWILTRRRGRRLRAALFGLYLLLLAGLTLFPIPPVNQRSSVAQILARVNWQPFIYLRYLQDYIAYVVAREIILNVLLTVPFGFFIRGRGWRLAVWMVTPGLAIEASQLVASLAVGAAYRTVDISDVLLNTLGVLLGFALARVLRRCRADHTARRTSPSP